MNSGEVLNLSKVLNLLKRHSCGNSSGVEHNLAKVGVASSNLVSRSTIHLKGTQMPQNQAKDEVSTSETPQNSSKTHQNSSKNSQNSSKTPKKFSKLKDFFIKGVCGEVLSSKFIYIVLANSLTFHGLTFGDDFSEFAERFMKNFFWNFGSFFVLLSFCSLLKPKLYQTLLNTLFWASFLIAIVNIFLLVNFNFTLNSIAIETLFATNIYETSEFLDLYVADNLATIVILTLFVAASIGTFLLKFKLAFSRKAHLAIALIIAFFIADNYKKGGVLHQMEKTAIFYAFGGVYFETLNQKNTIIELEKSKKEIQAMLDSKVVETGGGGRIA